MAGTDLHPGSRLGPYRIEEPLGRGATGAVFRAVHVETGTAVALKVLARAVGADALARFRREARAIEAIEHPNVVRQYGSGEDAGRAFLALELVPGGSLEERLRKGGPLAPLEAARRGAEIARGLASIHSAGLVHRDLKPANVLLDAEGRAKVSDLGLVRTLSRADESRRLTETSAVVGTPSYLSPEQCDGREAIPASDLYALGVTLHALVAGRPPFEGELVNVMMKHLTAKPDPLSARAKDVPPALDALVARLLAKDPPQRGASAATVAEELDAIASPRRRASASHGVAAFIAAIAAVLVVALVIATPPAPPSPAESTAVAVPGSGSAAPLGTSPPTQVSAPASPLRETARWGDASWMTTEDNHISCLAFLPGDREAVVAADGRLWVFEVPNGALRACFASSGRYGRFSSIAVSPDGRFIAAGLVDWIQGRPEPEKTGPIDVWDRPARARKCRLREGQPATTAVAWLDGTRLLAGSADGDVEEIDVETGSSRAVARTGSAIRSISVAARSGRVLVVDENAAHLGPPGALEPQPATEGMSHGALLANGDLALLVHRASREASVISLNEWRGKVVARDVDDVAVAPTMQRVAIASGATEFFVLDVDTGARRGPPAAPLAARNRFAYLDRRRAVALSGDGEKLLTVGWDMRVRFFRHADLARRTVDERPGASLICLDASADGKLVAGACRDGSLRLWDAELSLAWRRDAEQGELTSIAISPDGSRVVTGGYRGSTRLWRRDEAEGGPPIVLTDRVGTLPVAFARDGNSFAAGTADEQVHVLDLQGNETAVFKADSAWLKRLAFTEVGVYARSDSNTPVQFRHWNMGERGYTFLGGESHVFDVDVGRTLQGTERLAAALGDGSVRMWDVKPETPASKRGGAQRAYVRPGERALAVALLDSTRYLAASYEDGSLRVFATTPDDKAPIAELTVAPDRITSLAALGRAGRTFVAGTNRGLLLRYELTPEPKKR